MTSNSKASGDLPILPFKEPDEWNKWLEEHHASFPGTWLKLAKTKIGTLSINYDQTLDSSPEANTFYSTLNNRNTYAILYRIQRAKKPETRQNRIRQRIEMLEMKEKLYP